MVKKIKKILQAQVTSEFALVAILISASIIIMGPYVVRSWNAYLKSWDSSIEEAYTDPFIEHDTSGINIPPCDCGPWIKQGCGMGGCDAREMSYTRVCLPLGCENSTYPPQEVLDCHWDDSCCTAFTPTGLCGVNAVHVADGFCPDGKMEMVSECGEDSNQIYTCSVDDHPMCVFVCLWAGTESPDSVSQWCTAEEQIELPFSIYASIVDDCGQAGSGGLFKCRKECINGTVPDTAHTFCTCPSAALSFGGACPADSVDQTGSVCGPGEIWK